MTQCPVSPSALPTCAAFLQVWDMQTTADPHRYFGHCQARRCYCIGYIFKYLGPHEPVADYVGGHA